VATNQIFSTERGDRGDKNENKKPRSEWWDGECRKAMEEKNFARMKCINRRKRINQNDYMQKGRLLIAYVKETRRTD
jgi:hypothetical protein